MHGVTVAEFNRIHEKEQTDVSPSQNFTKFFPLLNFVQDEYVIY
jgi:hypothetical protein